MYNQSTDNVMDRQVVEATRIEDRRVRIDGRAVDTIRREYQRKRFDIENTYLWLLGKPKNILVALIHDSKVNDDIVAKHRSTLAKSNSRLPFDAYLLYRKYYMSKAYSLSKMFIAAIALYALACDGGFQGLECDIHHDNVSDDVRYAFWLITGIISDHDLNDRTWPLIRGLAAEHLLWNDQADTWTPNSYQALNGFGVNDIIYMSDEFKHKFPYILDRIVLKHIEMMDVMALSARTRRIIGTEVIVNPSAYAIRLNENQLVRAVRYIDRFHEDRYHQHQGDFLITYSAIITYLKHHLGKQVDPDFLKIQIKMGHRYAVLERIDDVYYMSSKPLSTRSHTCHKTVVLTARELSSFIDLTNIQDEEVARLARTMFGGRLYFI